jgi:hypothetical protein
MTTTLPTTVRRPLTTIHCPTDPDGGTTSVTVSGPYDDEARRYQVFAAYEGLGDRYTFGVRWFPGREDADRYAAWLARGNPGERFA